MQRKAFANLSLNFVFYGVLVSAIAQTQSGEPQEEPEIDAVVGAPFSGVAIRENTRATPDGNRFVRKITSRPYRDGQGRTRLEREMFTTINNKVTGEVDHLFAKAKVASVLQRPHFKVVDTPVALPKITMMFNGMWVGPEDEGWSAPVSLGEKSIEGLHVVGTQRAYTIAAGRVHNQNPINVTIQQWSSPDLGVIVDKTLTSSIGVGSHYQLTQIVQAEPDPALFKVPADYKKVMVKPHGDAEVTASAN